MKRNTTIYRFARMLPLLALLACLTTPAALAQSRITGLADCPPAGATDFHFDVTPLQADYKFMVSEYEVEPDITIMMNSRVEHPDYTLYVDSETYSPDEAAAVFAVLWERQRRHRSEAH